ncbi:hypothetical protein [Pontibacillus yanchengensis]|uniref:hypothetical protein n=1 Tax=Pontibacillus yanchengensis TaxID=462910 RepID=UPI0030840B61
MKNTLQEHNMKINYEFNNELASPMNYNVTTNTIKFNYLEVNRYINKINIKETGENLVKIILFREMGFYVTFKKNKHDLRTLIYGGEDEKAELQAVIEKNAWEYGRTLAPEHLVESYDKVRELDGMLIEGL